MKSEPESTYAWVRVCAALTIMTIGGAGMYSMGVALPLVQADFSATRGDASLPYTLTMIGFGIGGILMGRLADRFGIVVPVMIGALGLGAGFVLAGTASSLVQFSFAHGVLIGLLGCSATFAPLVADTSLWFNRRRGIAVAICASGNYLAGTVWPPILQYAFDTVGWRATYVGLGCFCTATMLLLALVLRRRPPALESSAVRSFSQSERPLGLSPNALLSDSGFPDQWALENLALRPGAVKGADLGFARAQRIAPLDGERREGRRRALCGPGARRAHGGADLF